MTQKRHFKESEYIFLGKKDESRYLIKFIIDNMCFLLSMKLKKICCYGKKHNKIPRSWTLGFFVFVGAIHESPAGRCRHRPLHSVSDYIFIIFQVLLFV